MIEVQEVMNFFIDASLFRCYETINRTYYKTQLHTTYTVGQNLEHLDHQMVYMQIRAAHQEPQLI